MVRHDEYRGVERRLVTPPPPPLVVVPRAALGPELVAAHDLGADVAGVVPREVVVETAVPPGSVRMGQLAVAPAQANSLSGSTWPNGRSKVWSSPAPKPSLETLKFWTLSNWATRSSWLSTTVVRLSGPAKFIAGANAIRYPAGVSHCESHSLTARVTGCQTASRGGFLLRSVFAAGTSDHVGAKEHRASPESLGRVRTSRRALFQEGVVVKPQANGSERRMSGQADELRRECRNRPDDLLGGDNGGGVVRHVDLQRGVHLAVRVAGRRILDHGDLVT